MIPIALAIFIWLPALVGIGFPILKFLNRIADGSVGSAAYRTAFAGLLGLFVASTLACTVGLVMPVRPAVSIVLLLAGWGSIIRHRRTWTRLPSRAWIGTAVLALIVIIIDARGRAWYDTGLYHLQAVAWMSAGPVPRGLANLYGPLGYNCAWFPLAAVIEFPLAAGHSCFVLNALITLIAALPGVDAILRAGCGRRMHADRIIYGLVLFPLAEFGSRWGMISSLAPDLIVMILVLFTAAVWVRSPRNALLSMTLASFAVSIKLSAGPLLLIAALAAIAGRKLIVRPRSTWLLLGLLAMVGCSWFIRGILLSGYPAFPATIGRFASLPWTAPIADACNTARAIEFWSKYHRDYSAVYPGQPWVVPWIHRIGFSEPILVAVISLLIGLTCLGLRRSPLTAAGRRAMIAAIGMLPAIAFWFMMAPDVRFGFGYVFAVASLVVAAAFAGLRFQIIRLKWRRAFVSVVGMGLLVVCRLDHRLFKVTFVTWPPIPVASLTLHHANDGTTVYMPINDDRVWAAPPPATPELNPTLRCIRDSNDQIREFDVTAPRVN